MPVSTDTTPPPSIGDLRRLYYGGGTQAEYQYLLDAAEAGISAADILALAEGGGGGGLTEEQIGDLVGAMVTGGTESGITVGYDDPNQRLDFTVPSASDTAEGLIETATGAETTTGTDADRAVTPAGLKVVTDTLQTVTSAYTTYVAQRSIERATWPNGALGITIPDRGAPSNSSPLSSGRLCLQAIALEAGATITNIVWMSATTAGSAMTNQWFGLFDNNRNALRLTADQTSGAWGANTAKSVALTSTFVTTYSGLHYIGVCVVGTPPTLMGLTPSNSAAIAVPPIVSGFSTTGLTTPPGLPFQGAALSVNGAILLGWVT
jgi:hypothetical protein